MKRLGLVLFMCNTFNLWAQCDEGSIELSMNIYTDPWGYETYWELVPGTNPCGDGTLVWGSNIEYVGCAGGGEQNAIGSPSAYPSNTVVNVQNICLIDGAWYTLHFVDDWGDGGLYFEMFQDGSLVGIYQGTGIGNSWTFQAGVNPLGPYDSPCAAIEILPQQGQAVHLNNSNCYTQVNEISPLQVHCMADGTWCSDPVQHSIWAQFTVPDSGSFEISTVHNGTYINTQMAIWYAADCSDPSTFVLLASNDDYWGDAENISCNANPPGCVNQASAAYLNVIQTYPACCENGWDDACQALYDSQNSSCSIPVDCAYVLKGFDSYGDGWNDCQVVVTIAGETTNYTFTEGSTAEWNIPFADGDDVSLSFIAAGWPEEVSIQLISPFNEVLFEGPLVNLGIDFYSTIASCSPPIYQHPLSSRCFVNCLPAGATCFIQLDGFNNETGDIVLSVEPFSGTPSILTLSQDLTCPPAVGVTPESYIITHIEGWGLNHSAQWTGPNDYSSQDYHISELMPGNYQVTFTNACQGQLTTEVEISGPQPYQITHSSMPSCFESTDGSIAFSMAGGTAPLSTTWTFPDGTNHTNPPLNQLSPGLYQLHITDANNCSIMAPIEVETLPMPLFSLGEDLVVCQNFAIQLEGPDTMNTYLWSNNTTAQNAIFTHENYPPGIYALSLTVTNELGCHYQDAITLEVQECTSIDKPSTSISAFPNPAHDVLYISGTPACLILLDAFGKTVFQNLHPVSNPILDISFLSSGIYFLRCSQTDAQPSFKIFIEH